MTLLVTKRLNKPPSSRNLKTFYPARTWRTCYKWVHQETFGRGTLKDSTDFSHSPPLMTNSSCSGWGHAHSGSSPKRDNTTRKYLRRVNMKLDQVKNISFTVWQFFFMIITENPVLILWWKIQGEKCFFRS